MNSDGAAAADAAGIDAGEVLAEHQRSVVGDCRVLEALVSPISVPPLMVQFWAPLPVSVHTEVPILLKTEKP